MAEAWKVRGREVPDALRRVATSEQALASLDAALAELDVRVLMARELALGPMAAALAVHARGPRPDGITPADLLREALVEVRSLIAAHGDAARVFDQYRSNFDDAGKQHSLGELVDARRSDTARAAKEALDNIVAAGTHSEAASEFYSVAQGVPYHSPLWDGWTGTAENLARLAFQEATAAHGALTRMLHCVALEFFAAWMLIKAAEKEPWKRLARREPATLELVAGVSGIMEDLRTLHRQLQNLAGQLRVKTTTVSAATASGSSSPPAVIAVLEAAHRELTRVMALHAATGRVFTLCAPHLDVEGDTVRTWGRHRAEAVSAGHEAMRRMADAASAWMALDSILSVAEPRRVDADHLLGQTLQQLGNARDALRRMRDAISIQSWSEDAWRVEPDSVA